MKRYVLVYNPVSGHATFRQRLDGIIEAFQRRRTMLIPYRTSLGDTEMGNFIREAAPEGVLAAGGDGTLHEVVNVLMREKLSLPIGIIGSGICVYALGYMRDFQEHEPEGARDRRPTFFALMFSMRMFSTKPPRRSLVFT